MLLFLLSSLITLSLSLMSCVLSSLQHSGSRPPALLARPHLEHSRDLASLLLPPTIRSHQSHLAARPPLSGHRLEARYSALRPPAPLASSNPLPHLAPLPPLHSGAPRQLSVHRPPLHLVLHPLPLALVCLMHSLFLYSLVGSPC